MNTAYMTHALVPINWDDLYTDDADLLSKSQIECMWPYFKIEKSKEIYREREKRYRVFQMWKTSIFHLGQFDKTTINSEKLFLDIPLPKRKISYGVNNGEFYNMDKDTMFLLIVSNVLLMNNYFYRIKHLIIAD